MERKFLVFDIWSDYAHFKKPYTTTSPLTFSVPPLSTLSGIIASIIGLQKDSYFDIFTPENTFLAVRILNPVKKVRMGINLINTDGKFNKIKNRKPTKVEFLKEPKYRIYFSHKELEPYQTLKHNLISHCSVFTVTLGLSENIANFDFIGEFEAFKEKMDSFKPVNSIIKLDNLTKENIDFLNEGEYFSENIPGYLGVNRISTSYHDVLFERNGKNISAQLDCTYFIRELNERISVL